MSRRRPGPAPDMDAAGRLRLDRWLWHVRACRTRTLAAALIAGGGVRVNGQPCRKPGRPVGPGDVVTVATAGRVLTYEVLATGDRRGPAAEAATLYRDLAAGDGAAGASALIADPRGASQGHSRPAGEPP